MISLFLALLFFLTGQSLSYVTPTGQFCPHRSDAWYDYMDQLQAVGNACQDFTTTQKEQVREIEDLADNSKLTKLSQKLDTFLVEWKQLTAFGQTSTDYQLREYLAEPHFYNLQLAEMESDMIPVCQRLSKHCRDLLSEEDGLTPSRSDKLWKLHQSTSLQRNSIDLPPEITASPFVLQKEDKSLQAQPDVIKKEYIELLHDHRDLIVGGSDFGAFDLKSKQSFVERLKGVEDRWDIVFQRFKLMNAVNPDYVQQCNVWLANLGLDEQQYKTIHQTIMGKFQDGSNDIGSYYSVC